MRGWGGWVQGESHQAVLLRPLVLRRLAEYGHGGTIRKCQELFQKMVKDPKYDPTLCHPVTPVALVQNRQWGNGAMGQGR